ncbi:MAG: Short C-terminal domain [Miltoncostaeaceae bacterium]|jgi:hypothetical protein|nr:Short C-terminal domain [Miltoncostaeaceae bacterium]
MSDAQEQARRAFKEMMSEFHKAMEQGNRMLRQAGDDLTRWVGHAPAWRRGDEPTPLELIRQLGELRAEGLITEEEFQAKKAELLSKV